MTMITENFNIYRSYPIPCTCYRGEGEIKMLIIGVHGFCGDRQSSMLKMLGKSISKKGGALLCLDLPAHGESPACEDELTVNNCIEDILFLCREGERMYNVSKKAIFATSFGAYLALLASHRLSDYSFILRAPAVTMPTILFDTVLKIQRDSFEKAGRIACGFERKLSLPFSFALDLEAQPSLFEKPLTSPATVIHGDCDDIVPYAHALEYCRRHPDVRLCTVIGADHRFKGKGHAEEALLAATAFLED